MTSNYGFFQWFFSFFKIDWIPRIYYYYYKICLWRDFSKNARYNDGGWMDCQWRSSIPARGAQEGYNVLHGLSSMFTNTYCCIRPEFNSSWTKQFLCCMYLVEEKIRRYSVPYCFLKNPFMLDTDAHHQRVQHTIQQSVTIFFWEPSCSVHCK
jgi:hypothetical protein